MILISLLNIVYSANENSSAISPAPSLHTGSAPLYPQNPNTACVSNNNKGRQGLVSVIEEELSCPIRL